MFRRCYEYMFDELEIPNYPRWFAAPNPVCYALPDFIRASRYDAYGMEYPRQPYWMSPNWIFPNSDPFFKRNERRSYHPKNTYFPRDKRNCEQRCHDHRFEREDGNFRHFERGKRGNAAQRIERRMQANWDKEAITSNYHSFSRDERNQSRLHFRNSSVDLCPEDFVVPHQTRNLKQPYEVSGSLAYATLKGKERNPQNLACESKAHQDSSVTLNYGETSGIKWKPRDTKSSSNHIADCLENESSSDFTSICESWYCPQEQQQIVDTLKEVNLRHERQLRRDMIKLHGDRQCSDESVSSTNESSCLECLQKSLSSDDDEETITVLLSPGGAVSVLDGANADEDLQPGYLEQTATDFFEEFQSIFTGSPEKQIINDLTKESLKMPSSAADDGSTKIVGKRISTEDKDAVKTVLNFEDIDETTCQAKNISNSSSSSQKTTPSDQLSVTSSEGQSENFPVENKTVLNESSTSKDLIANTSDISVRGFDRSRTSRECESSNNSKMSFHKTSLHFANKISNIKDIILALKQLNKHSCGDEKIKYFETYLKNISLEKRLVIGNLSERLQETVKKVTKAVNLDASLNKSKNNGFSIDTKKNTPNIKSILEYTNSQESEPNEVVTKCKTSFSEPFLDSNKGEVVYRRISVSEIFDSVNTETENNIQILKQRQNHINSFFNQFKPEATMSPSEHLKLILGIGQGVDKVKEKSDCGLESSGLVTSTSNETLTPLLAEPDSKDCVIKLLSNGTGHFKSTSMFEKHERHLCCPASGCDPEAAKYEAGAGCKPQTSVISNGVSAELLNNFKEPKLQIDLTGKMVKSSVKNMSEDLFQYNTKEETREVKNNCKKFNYSESRKYASAKSKCYKSDKDYHIPKNSPLDENSKGKTSKKRNSSIRESGRNENNCRFCESYDLKYNPCIQKVTHNEVSRNSSLIHKSELQIQNATSYEQEVRFSKPKRKLKHRKRKPKYSDESTGDRFMGCDNSEKQLGGNEVKEIATNFYKDSFKAKNHQRINSVTETSETLQYHAEQEKQNKCRKEKTNNSSKVKWSSSYKSKNTELYEISSCQACHHGTGDRPLPDERNSNDGIRKCDQMGSLSGCSDFSSARRVWNNRTKTLKTLKRDNNSPVGPILNGLKPREENECASFKQAKSVDSDAVQIKPRIFFEKISEHPKARGQKTRRNSISDVNNRSSNSLVSESTGDELARSLSEKPNQMVTDYSPVKNAVGFDPRELIVDVEKASYLLKKRHFRFKPQEERGNCIHLKYCPEKPTTFPHPLNRFVLDHLLNQKFDISLLQLKVKGASISVIVVSTMDKGRDGTFFHLIKHVGKNEYKSEVQLKDTETDMRRLKNVAYEIFGRQQSVDFLILSDVFCIVENTTNGPKSLQHLQND